MNANLVVFKFVWVLQHFFDISCLWVLINLLYDGTTERKTYLFYALVFFNCFEKILSFCKTLLSTFVMGVWFSLVTTNSNASWIRILVLKVVECWNNAFNICISYFEQNPKYIWRNLRGNCRYVEFLLLS